ncbi:hypothetical protein [Mammaliicoccus sp. Dog046]|uniref:hypothetical protein n=1 Tax=Mammaliicoccus sp. Dog046 TaxID=3034233 RepID=UPI002B25DD06|nr:hypothetical protein [Mammaliicoccus sp. Dog046]WQK86354.1 hypothetical protein P3U32_04910 [Mammaliicoccus sp. Dog046]
MKKLILSTLVITITFILASCAPQGQSNFKNGNKAIESFQKNIKDVDSHSIKSQNKTTIDFQDHKTTFNQTSHGRSNHHDKLAFNIEQKSSNKRFNTQNKSIFIQANELKSSPRVHYLNYEAQNAEIDHYQKIGQDWFDLTTFNQSMLKPIENDVTIDGRTLTYDGTNKDVLKYLYQLGYSQSPLVDQQSLSQIDNLNVKSGKFKLTFKDNKTLPEKLTFSIKATGYIKNEKIKINMNQTTDFYNFNKTKVKPYDNLTKNKYK